MTINVVYLLILLLRRKWLGGLWKFTGAQEVKDKNAVTAKTLFKSTRLCDSCARRVFLGTNMTRFQVQITCLRGRVNVGGSFQIWRFSFIFTCKWFPLTTLERQADPRWTWNVFLILQMPSQVHQQLLFRTVAAANPILKMTLRNVE